MRNTSRYCVCLGLGVLMLLGGSALGQTTLYVAVNGNDAWSGTLPGPNAENNDGPFASLERARDAVRALKAGGALPAGGVQVLLKGGIYALSKPLELGAEDSGTAETPVVYASAPGENVRLMGGKAVTGFQPVTDPKALERLDESARANVVQADLKTLGITDFGPPDGGGMEVFFQDQPMTLSRWPNEGFVRIVDLVEKDDHAIHGVPGSKTGKFTYDGDRPKRWIGEKDPWLHGYWFWDWSDQRQQIESIDVEKSIIAIKPPYHGYGYRKNQWYYAFNMLSELDRPGEWYMDREAGTLYFWPPAPLDTGSVVVSVLPTLITMKDVSFVTLRGMLLEAGRGTAIGISGGAQDRIETCTLRNMGSGAVSVGGGEQHAVTGCEIYAMGGGGISLDGGDRTTLTPAKHLAENNHIHDYGRWYRMYQMAIALNGVGNRAAHNLIHDAPHIAITFGGNDHVIEFNEIHHVCEESNDAGAIYAGRNWTMRGTLIRHNYLHDITGFEGRGCVGVYLDDMFCGTTIYGNLFHKVTMAAFIGGGRDNVYENNVFVDCAPALHIDGRALGWAGYHSDDWIKEGREKGTHLGIAFLKPPYTDRYPQLLTILDDEPKAPKGNVIARNICVGGKWDDVEEAVRPMISFQDNLVNEDPHFVDAANLDFRLKDDAPAFKLGFKPIPIEQIGLLKPEQAPVAVPDRAGDLHLVSVIDVQNFGAETLRVGDLNHDGGPDLLFVQSVRATREITCLTATSIFGEVLWQNGVPSLDHGEIYSDLPVQIYDWDRDGKNEVLYVRQAVYAEPPFDGQTPRERAARYEGNATMAVLDGQTGREKGTFALPAPADDSFLFADLTGRGRREDLVVKDRYWNMWGMGHDASVLWHWEGSTGHFPAIADVDSDGRDEVFVGFALVDHDGKEMFSHDAHGAHQDAAWITHGPDHAWQLLFGNGGIHCLAPDGSERWSHPLGEAQHVVAGHFRDDSPLQYIVIDRTPVPHRRDENAWGILYLYGADGTEIWSRKQEKGAWAIAPEPIRWLGHGKPQCVMIYGRGYGQPAVIYDGNGEVVATLPLQYTPGRSEADRKMWFYGLVADVWGDEREEVLLFGSRGACIYANAQLNEDPALYNETLYPGM